MSIPFTELDGRALLPPLDKILVERPTVSKWLERAGAGSAEVSLMINAPQEWPSAVVETLKPLSENLNLDAKGCVLSVSPRHPCPNAVLLDLQSVLLSKGTLLGTSVISRMPRDVETGHFNHTTREWLHDVAAVESEYFATDRSSRTSPVFRRFVCWMYAQLSSNNVVIADVYENDLKLAELATAAHTTQSGTVLIPASAADSPHHMLPSYPYYHGRRAVPFVGYAVKSRVIHSDIRVAFASADVSLQDKLLRRQRLPELLANMAFIAQHQHGPVVIFGDKASLSVPPEWRGSVPRRALPTIPKPDTSTSVSSWFTQIFSKSCTCGRTKSKPADHVSGLTHSADADFGSVQYSFPPGADGWRELLRRDTPPASHHDDKKVVPSTVPPKSESTTVAVSVDSPSQGSVETASTTATSKEEAHTSGTDSLHQHPPSAGAPPPSSTATSSGDAPISSDDSEPEDVEAGDRYDAITPSAVALQHVIDDAKECCQMIIRLDLTKAASDYGSEQAGGVPGHDAGAPDAGAAAEAGEERSVHPTVVEERATAAHSVLDAHGRARVSLSVAATIFDLMPSKLYHIVRFDSVDDIYDSQTGRVDVAKGTKRWAFYAPMAVVSIALLDTVEYHEACSYFYRCVAARSVSS